MAVEKKKAEQRMLLLITTPKLARKAAALFEQGRIPILYQFHGQGTASSEIMETLGLGSIDKMILLSMVPRCFAGELLKKLRRELRLGSSNSGIAVTLPLSGGSGRLIKLLESLVPDGGDAAGAGMERSGMAMSDNRYVMILTIVDRGFSEDVMSAARPAGAAGGTVFNSRRLVNEDTMKFWGMSVQQEREIVAIIAEEEHKLPIMQAISERCGMRSEAHGVVLSMPVDQVMGMD